LLLRYLVRVHLTRAISNEPRRPVELREGNRMNTFRTNYPIYLMLCLSSL
jgi:hypothetical protein